MHKSVIIIAGPTAVGKTSVAIALAKHFHTEIISADSRQCYKEMKIGVARPSEEELADVPHHFIASHSIHDKITAADFEKYALSKLDTLFKTHDVVIMTGGTGLYIKAFCEGLDEIPEVPAVIHEEIISSYKTKGLAWLQQEVQEADPGFYATSENQNPQRLMRALEVFRATGKSISHFRKGNKANRDFRIIKIALNLPKEELQRNINARVDQMVAAGLENEARSLMPYQHLNALQTVGYREWFDHFNGIMSKEAAIERIKINTRQYAKRQITWFKKDEEIEWMKPDVDSVIDFAAGKVKIQKSKVKIQK